jgi:hypothetical protein
MLRQENKFRNGIFPREMFPLDDEGHPGMDTSFTDCVVNWILYIIKATSRRIIDSKAIAHVIKDDLAHV